MSEIDQDCVKTGLRNDLTGMLALTEMRAQVPRYAARTFRFIEGLHAERVAKGINRSGSWRVADTSASCN